MMGISWWQIWWRQRRRAPRRPLWLRQRGLSLENLEDRRLLSAVLAPDPGLKLLAVGESPTAQVALVAAAHAAVEAVPDATQGIWSFDPPRGGDRPAGTALTGTHGSQSSFTPDQLGTADPGSGVPTPDATAGLPSIGAPSTLDMTFAAGDPGLGLLDGGAPLTVAVELPPPARKVPLGGALGTTADDLGILPPVPMDSGGDDTTPSPVAPDSRLGTSLTQVKGRAADPPADPGSRELKEVVPVAGKSSGGADQGDDGTDRTPEPVGDSGTGDLPSRDRGPAENGGREHGSGDAGDQSGTSDGSSDDSPPGMDDGTPSPGDDGQVVASRSDRTAHAQPDDPADAGDQTAAADASAGARHHTGSRGGSRGRHDSGDSNPADQGPAAAVASDDSAAGDTARLPADAREEKTTTADDADVALVVDPAGAAAVTAVVTVGRHHHHRVGPFFLPTMSAAELGYAQAAWGAAADGGMDDCDGYVPQNYDFTTKVCGLPNFRPDGLARGDKAAGLSEKAGWRSLASSILGRTATPVLIGWGTAASALAGGEGTTEVLEWVYNFQAAASNRLAEMTGNHHAPARALKDQDFSPGDPGLAPAASARFFATRALPPAEVNHGPGRSSWQLAVAAAEVDPGRIEHLVAGSFRTQHLNTDGDNPGDAQRLDGRGWWGIVAQFILAPQFPHNHQPTIMLAVADEPSRDALNVALVKANFMVLTAATAREAMKLLRTPLSPVDVALLDVHLPDVNGVDLCSRLRELYPTLPVLVCTDQAEQGDVNQLQKLNVLRIFSKPVAIGELLAAVKGIVS